MSNYLPEIRYASKWDGDDVLSIMSPLTKGDMMKMGAVRRSNLDSYALAVDVLTERLVKIEGLKDRNGNPVPKEEILNRFYFMDLVTEVFAKLVEASILPKVTGTESSQNLSAGSTVPQ